MKKRNDDPIKKRNENSTVPKTNNLLLIASLVSVPISYFFLFLSAFLSIGCTLLFFYITFLMWRRASVVILALNLAFLALTLASLRAIWVIFFHKAELQSAVAIDIYKTPTLNTVINEICKKVGTKKPNVVLLHAEPIFFVQQGKLETYDGIVQGRILAMGVPLLRQLNCSELKSVLAHEFAHFSGKDTLYSAYVYPVYKSLITAMNVLKGSGDQERASLGGVAFNLFLSVPLIVFNCYLRYFTYIDKALSRGRELRADCIAANIYGNNTMAVALKKVYSISRHYGESAYDIAINSSDTFFDNYQEFVLAENNRLTEYESLEMGREEIGLDTHPTLAARLKNLPEKDSIDSEDKIENIIEELNNETKRLSSIFTSTHKSIKDYYDELPHLLEKNKQEQMLELDKSKPLYCPNCYKAYNKFISNMCKGCGVVLMNNPNYRHKK